MDKLLKTGIVYHSILLENSSLMLRTVLARILLKRLDVAVMRTIEDLLKSRGVLCLEVKHWLRRAYRRALLTETEVKSFQDID